MKKECYAVDEISFTQILSDQFFKISRKNYINTLPQSLKQSGMLEVPFVIKEESGYRIFTCFNRISILRESGAEKLLCYILDEPDKKVFMEHATLKAYRNELGISGKLKTLHLLRSYFKTDSADAAQFCTKVLKLPLELAENPHYQEKIQGLPETLLTYIDDRDPGFKLIKDILTLPDEWIETIDGWLQNIQIRINIFRMLVDMMFDLFRRGDSISVIKEKKYTDDKTLYDEIHRLRYPQFSKMKSRTEKIIGEISMPGLSIDFPEYFDRSMMTIKLELDKKSGLNEQLKKVNEIDVVKLEELLSFL